MRIHLIATGGAVMHNMAIALHKKGYGVTGSDDAIYEPAKSRLEKQGLLPGKMGWNEDRITPDIDLVILGMHARKDNPELVRALKMNIPVMSFPEFLYEQSKNKLRVVIAGSHGKTTITSMVMHVLRRADLDFDYAVGSSIEGFEDSVKLTEDAPVIIIEGDEYLSSPIDRKPKFLWYHPQIALINGIAWDHINVFPTYEEYVKQFQLLIEDMQPGGKLIYYSDDKEVAALVEKTARHLDLIPTHLPEYRIEQGQTIVRLGGRDFPITVFGEHNLQNLAGAQAICEQLGVSAEDFWNLVADFKGAGKRLEKVENDRGVVVFRDFAHAPSKVKGSTEAVAMQYPGKKLVALLELHTFSSLNKSFTPQYAGSLDKADKAYVYVDTEAVKAKGGDIFTEEEIREAFGNPDIIFLQKGEDMIHAFRENLKPENVLLVMSSGNLGGLDVKKELN